MAAQQISESEEVAALPDAPEAQSAPGAAEAKQATPEASHGIAKKNCPPVNKAASGPAVDPQKNGSTGCKAKWDFAYPFGKPPGHGQRLTSTDKLRIAASDVVDPFNLLTIAAT